MPLHHNELAVDESLIRTLLLAQCPRWAGLPLVPAGAGTDNTMYRLGSELLVRMPRTPDGAGSIRKEQVWLPRLGPRLGLTVPEPVHVGAPSADFPLPWSVYRWIDGDVVRPDTVRDWAGLGADLAAFVRELHGTDLLGASRGAEFGWYRGGLLGACDEWFGKALEECRTLAGDELDVDMLERLWREALRLPDPAGPHGWLHGDLKPTNLLVRDGRLHAVIDFGGLTVGFPDAEHAPVWDLPVAARRAYRETLGVDESTWIRARAWALVVGVSGLAYYWHSYPEFVAECRGRLDAVLADAAGG